MHSFSLLALLPMALAFTGKMTYYNPSVGLGSCGQTFADTDFIVAISAAKMNSGGNPSNNPLCFSTITITNSAGVSQEAKVTDTCPICGENDIDVSPAVFQAFGALGEGKISGITWTGSAFGGGKRGVSGDLVARKK